MKPNKIDPESLGKSLAEYGSLDRAIEAKKGQLASMQAQVEQLQKTRAKLEPEVQELLQNRISLEKENRQLEKLNDTLAETIKAMGTRKKYLDNCLPALEGEVAALEAKKAGLVEESRPFENKIQEMEEKLKVVPAMEKEIEEKAKLMQDLDMRISAAGFKFQLFDGFLGFVGANTGTQMEPCLRSLPGLIDDAQTGKYDAAFLRKYVIGKLTWSSLDVMACSDCGVEFVVIRRTQVRGSIYYKMYDGGLRHCPVCGRMTWVECKNELARMLEEELKPKVQPTRFVVVKGPTKGIVEQHNSPDMKASP
jgi:FtsZ-binding cell division protein ZapB